MVVALHLHRLGGVVGALHDEFSASGKSTTDGDFMQIAILVHVHIIPVCVCERLIGLIEKILDGGKVRVFAPVVRVHGRPGLGDLELGAEDAVHQQGLVGVHGAVRVLVGQIDGQLLHHLAGAHVLLAVHHLDADVLAQLVNLAVALVPQLQGVVAEDLVVPDLLVQIPDVVEDAVDILHGVLELLEFVRPDGLQALGAAVEELDQGGSGRADQIVVLVGAHPLLQALQGVKELVDLVGDDAEVVRAPAHLVQDVAELVQALQPGLGLAHRGLLVAEADIHVGVPQLGGALAQHAVAHIHHKAAGVLRRAGGVEAHQIHTLAGVAHGVDVGDIVSGHVQRRLGGIDAQACGCERAEGP